MCADAAVLYDDDIVTITKDMFHIMCNQQNGLMKLPVHAHKELHHLSGSLWIQTGRRFIQNENIGIHRQDTGNGDPSLLSAGKFKR